MRLDQTRIYLAPASNSALFASLRPGTDRANSMIAICIPRRPGLCRGMEHLFSLAYMAHGSKNFAFDSSDPWPKPPGTRTPSAPP